MNSRPNSILYTAYPLLPVTEDSAGGAEQMLRVLEQQMAARGHRTAIAACDGSTAAGEVVGTGREPDTADRFEVREREHDTRVLQHLAERTAAGKPYDLVHDESGSFWRHARALQVPVLATLHLPRSFYRPQLFTNVAPNVFFNCVSEAQAGSFAELPRMIGVIANGIDVERFPFMPEKRGYLLWVGRICEEKGTHLAIEVAAQTGLPLIIVGQIYPFSYHERYYESFVRPHLNGRGARVRFVDTPTFEQKRDLLRNARALLVPSLCEETSSLVSLEAMACGTPVIAFRRGGLAEVIADGETGWLVDTMADMAAAVARTAAIDPQACRARVISRYSAQRMADGYEQLYRRLLAEWHQRTAVLPAQ